MQRLPGLDLLRAISIIWVMYFHAQVLGVISRNPVANFGWMGVDMFFVLSGFLIGSQLFTPYAHGHHLHLKTFYLRRLLRTLPAYMVVLTLYYTVPIFIERPGLAPIWQYLSFTENLFVDFDTTKAFSHVWSLCVEEQFYLFAPLVVILLAWRPAIWKIQLLFLLLFIGGIVLRGFLWLHYLAPLYNAAHPKELITIWLETIYYPTWTRLDDLLIGILLALIRTFHPHIWLRCTSQANLLLMIGIIGIVGSIWLFQDQQALMVNLVGFPFLSLSLGCVVAAGASSKGLIGSHPIPGARLIATLAYSLYLTHKQIYHLVFISMGPFLVNHPAIMFISYSGAVFFAGAFLYFVVERPFLNLRKCL